MLDLIETLAFQTDADFRFFKFSNCIFNTKTDTLKSVFFYDTALGEKFTELKSTLETKFKDAVAMDITYEFEYKKSFMDAILLNLETRKFLTREFGILTLNLDESDIKIEDRNNTFDVNLYLPAQTIDYIRSSAQYAAFVRRLRDENFCDFAFYFNAKPQNAADSTSALEKLEEYMRGISSNTTETRVDKTLKVKGVEYWLGRPINEKPIKTEFLRISEDEQTTAGTMEYLTKRDYQRQNKKTGETEDKVRWTFVLNDGRSRVNCVFFPSAKTYSKFEKLTNGTAICACGVYSEYNGRASLRVSGISFCELVR